MQYRCPLTERLRAQAAEFSEFANGAAQATVKLVNGRLIPGVLISDAGAIIAARGYDAPPFTVDEIESVYQSAEDENPKERGGWKFWDDWK